MRTLAVLAGALAVVVAADVAAVPVHPPKKDPPKDPVKEEMRKLEGSWEVVAMESRGRQRSGEVIRRVGYKLTFKGEELIPRRSAAALPP
jgi:hypothetical protein